MCGRYKINASEREFMKKNGFLHPEEYFDIHGYKTRQEIFRGECMKLKYRFIYDDDGNALPEGSKVWVNGIEEGILHFNTDGEIKISGTMIPMEDIETVEAMPDDRYEGLDSDSN